MRALIIRHLPIPRLLMLPLHHHARRLRPHVHQINQRGYEHGAEEPGVQGVGGTLAYGGGGEEGQEARGAGGVGQQEGEWESGLQGEVDGEGGFLEGAELGAREDAVGYYAGDEGLEEGAAEEGAVAETMLVEGIKIGGLGEDLRRWYVAGFLKE
jgi:hypothetical protein